MKLIITLLFILIGFPVFADSVYASENQYVTIVNPLRIAPYTRDSSKSVEAEYQIINSNGLPATWLLTYDVLSNKDTVEVIKKMNADQEIGVFLEVSPLLCEKAQVTCNTGSWYHANVIFLSGYNQEDRKKLIDTIFSLFYETFGYYPKSVGSWWTDAFSLSYMKEKYGIIANLTCSDQFATDGYQLWGQYWMMPFMPSKYHAGMPAVSKQNQLDLVTLQWAPREPLKGYVNSLYSTQDYQTSPLTFDIKYFEKLIKTYGEKNKNSFGQITVGLEGDYNPNDYQGEYKNQMESVKGFIENGELKPVTMSAFSEWYRNTYKKTEPSFIESNQFESKPQKAFWYSSKNIRVGLVYDEDVKKIDIIDFRFYSNNFQEPYFVSPNNEIDLSINIPSIIDTVSDQNTRWSLPAGNIKSVTKKGSDVSLQFDFVTILLYEDKIVLKQDNIVVPKTITSNKMLQVNKSQNNVSIKPFEQFLVSQDGLILNSLSQQSINELKRKRTKAIFFLGTVVLGFTIFFISKRNISLSQKIFFISISCALYLFSIFVWYQKNLVTYYVSQSEIEALLKLSIMPEGKVLVYGRACIGCEWSTKYKPASYENQKQYVENFSSKSIVYNTSVFEAKTQEEARKEFQALNVSYIYLVKYEGMREKIPFSPGDLNIEKVYANANAEIWKVK